MGEGGGRSQGTREARIKAALRENLKRRKQKARAVADRHTPEEPTKESDTGSKAGEILDRST